MKPLVLLCISVILCCSSCQPVNTRRTAAMEPGKLEQLSWMLGKWQMATPEGIISEEWDKPSDTQWQGVSYMVSISGDTPFREQIRLRYSGEQLYYLPSVSGQNEGREVSFAEKSFSDSLVVFENLHHDFPQRIIYKRISDTSMLAAIEGSQNGQHRREEFAFSKLAGD